MRRTRPERGDSKEELNMSEQGLASWNTRKLTGTAILTAITIVLQFIGAIIRFGPFSITLVLVPIVIGAAMYGVFAGGWLGFVFGMTVLLSGDAAAFLAINPIGTVITVLVKGMAAGVLTAYVFRACSKCMKPTPATLISAIVCPIVNTGVFLLGCLLFFMPTINEWSAAAGFANTGAYMIIGLVGGNFLVEMLINLLLATGITRILQAVRKD